jgi:hypothetical protein
VLTEVLNEFLSSPCVPHFPSISAILIWLHRWYLANSTSYIVLTKKKTLGLLRVVYILHTPVPLNSLSCFGNVTCTHEWEDAVTCLLLALSTENVNVYCTQHEMETCWCTISIPSCPVKISLIYYAKHSDRLTHTS